MNESQIKFNNWCIELENRLLEFQVDATRESQNEYWMHRNCIMFDYEIHRLRKFGNPCRGCGIPLHLTNNFEAYLYGPVCGLCHTMHSIMAENNYFYLIQKKFREQKESGTQTA